MKIQRIALWVFWAALIIVSAFFYADNAVVYLFGYRNQRFAGNEFWFLAHIAGATCSLFLGPMQFWKVLRNKYLRLHRIAGKVYIIGSLVAAVSAFRLALIFDCVGCRYSLIPLSILFFFTTALAWYAVLQKNLVAHKQFMVRSYACALAFVFVRLYQVFPPIGKLFAPITDDSVLAVVMEWTFSILPLLLVEIFMIWVPSLRQKSVSRIV